MPTYPTYKLGDICELLNGFAFKSSNYVQSGLRVIRITNVKKGYVIDEEPQFYPLETQEELKKYILNKGDLLISLTGNVGRVGILREDLLPAALNQRVGCLRVKDKSLVSLQYLFHLLNTNSFEKDCINSSKGIAQKNMSTEWLKEYEINLPPLPTQQAIVARIEALFAELDKAAVHLRTAQQQLKTYRQAVLNHWLNNEDGKWEMVPIKEIISVISNGSTPKADKMFSKGEIQFLKVYNLNFDGSINLSKEPVFIERDTHETLLKRSQTKQGDVLINIVGPPLGKVSIIPEGEKEYNINQAIVMFRPNEFVTSKFLAYYLMSPQVIAWLTSTSKATAGQYNVKVSTCREIMFPKISISDQHRIVQEIESRLSQAEAAEASIAEALQKTEALRQSILKKAFSGELV